MVKAAFSRISLIPSVPHLEPCNSELAVMTLPAKSMNCKTFPTTYKAVRGSSILELTFGYLYHEMEITRRREAR